MRPMTWATGGVVLATMVLALRFGAGCGGKTVVDPGGSGGSTGSASGSTGSSTTDTASGGPSGCMEHEQCPTGLCIFATGRCAQPCEAESCDTCGQGEVCDECATSSCPQCLDCAAACVPAQPGQCDDHDDCGAQEVCIYESGRCAPTCDNAGGCADPSTVCLDCVTASCPCCRDCGTACVQP